MAVSKIGDRVNDLFDREDWPIAEKILVAERKTFPNDHWVVTQLGVSIYEQQRYEEALETFRASESILPSCPLTRWNLAGALGALDHCEDAIRYYVGLIEDPATPRKDPCWESETWARTLKKRFDLPPWENLRRRGAHA